MHDIDYVIIGGGIAGTTAAETIRKNDNNSTIAIISDEPHRLYSRIMLSKPNFFLEKIPFDSIWLKSESWYKDNFIQFFSGTKAVWLNTVSKIVDLNDGIQIHYGKLLLAVGGCARRWDVRGGEKKGIAYLRSLDEAKELISEVKNAKRAICIGSGFVSFEMCEMLRLAGLEVALVMREPYYWYPLLDETSGKLIEKAMEKGGVQVLCNAEVAEVMGGKRIEGVVLQDGSHVECQLAVVGIGLEFKLDWVKSAGVSVNRGIATNEYLESNISDVYAAGDAAEFTDLILGEKIQLGNWVNAQMQGKIAALTMLGRREPFRLVSFYTSQAFGITIAVIGDIRGGADRTVISRGTADANSYGRIIVKDGEILGASLINRTQELGAISKLIETNFKISGHETELSNPDFKLQELVK